MDIKEIQQDKLQRVTISYAYNSDEWCTIELEFKNGHAMVSRDQVEAFLRLSKTIEDMQKVQDLRDNLVKLFGASAQFAPSP